jgi:putative thioredoxin
MATAEPSHVVNVTPQGFQKDVVERSRTVPVVLFFWAEQVPAAKDMRRILETLAGQYGGKFALGLVDVARDQGFAQQLAQQLRVQSLPSLRVIHDGQIVDQMDGPQGERALREMLDQLTLTPGDLLREQLKQVLDARDFKSALAILKRALKEEPNNLAFKVELADVLAMTGDLDEARAQLATIPEATENRDRPATRIQMMEEAAGLSSEAEIRAGLQKNENDLELRYQAAVRAAVAGEYEAALEHAMAILRIDRKFRDDIGRATMVRIFTLLGKGSELASRYRRRMFNFMH